MAVLFVAGIGAFVAAGIGGGDDQSDLEVENSVALESLIPARGAEVLQQQQVGVDLSPGFTGSLVIDGRPIPDAELEGFDELNQELFSPGPGKTFTRLPADRVCAVFTYWPVADTTDVDDVTWCFFVL